MLAELPQSRTPHRHLLRTVSGGHIGITLDGLLHFRVRELPPFLLASWVRSAGATFRADAAGPFPAPVVPWQEAQYAMNISLPEAAFTFGNVDFFVAGLGDWLAWSCARPTRPAPSRQPHD